MKTITILKAVFFMTLTVLILPFYGCSILYNPLSFSEKNKEPILMSSQQALEYLAKKNIFLQQVYLVFDLQNQPSVRWSGTDAQSGKVYSIDAFAKNIIKKPFETASRILDKLYLGGKPYRIEEQQNNFVLLPVP